jgi:hypothetical protein
MAAPKLLCWLITEESKLDIEVYLTPKGEVRLRFGADTVALSTQSARVLAQQLIENAGKSERRKMHDREVELAQR